MAYQKIGVLFIALVICGQATAQGPISAPTPTSGADVPSFAPVSSPVVAPVSAPPTVPSVPPTVAPTIETPTLAPASPPPASLTPVSEVPTPSPADIAPAPGPSFEDSSAVTVSGAVWSILGLSSGLLIVLAY